MTSQSASEEKPPGKASAASSGGGAIVINLGRCRYEVIRDVAVALGFKIDYDLEQLACTISMTIAQPEIPAKLLAQRSKIPPSPTTRSGATAAASSSTATSMAATPNAAVSAAAHAPVMRSHLSLIAAGSNPTRGPLLHDAVFAMIESRRAHIIWSDVTVTPQQLGLVACYQRLNHFPGIAATLSRKVPLGQTMMRAWKAAPEFFAGVVPLSFSLRRDAALLRQYFEELEFSAKLKKKHKAQTQPAAAAAAAAAPLRKQPSASSLSATSASSATTSNPFLLVDGACGDSSAENARPRVFIFKPNSGCMGHDIRLTCRPLQTMNRLLAGDVHASKFLKEDEDYVVQQYIDRPLLIERRKFDLRVYVLLLGVSPDLRVLVHREGLVRLCASEYVAPKPSNVRKSTVHLTNYAVNKRKLGKECDAAKAASSSGGGARKDRDDDENDDAEEDDDEEDDAAGPVKSKTSATDESDAGDEQQTAATAPTLTISGIKRDFAFLNSFLDATFPTVGGSAAIWRRIDRAIVLTLLAAHDELDRTYRKAATNTGMLLRRAALQHIKDRRAAAEAAAAAAAAEKRDSVGDVVPAGVGDSTKKVAQLPPASNEAENSTNGADDCADEDDECAEDEDEVDDGESAPAQQTGKATAAAAAAPSLADTDPEEFVKRCCIGRNCFELLGYDMLLTEDGRAIVMEVNHGPSLETGAAIDTRIKSEVLTDVFRHVSVFLPDCKKKALRQRRYLQRIVKRPADSDLVLSPPTGFRVAYPPPDAALADEYRRAREALLGAPPVSPAAPPAAASGSASFRLQRTPSSVAANTKSSNSAGGLPPLQERNSVRKLSVAPSSSSSGKAGSRQSSLPAARR